MVARFAGLSAAFTPLVACPGLAPGEWLLHALLNVPLVPSRHCGVPACRLTMASAGHVTAVALTRTSHALAQYLHGDLHY